VRPDERPSTYVDQFAARVTFERGRAFGKRMTRCVAHEKCTGSRHCDVERATGMPERRRRSVFGRRRNEPGPSQRNVRDAFLKPVARDVREIRRRHVEPSLRRTHRGRHEIDAVHTRDRIGR
jgi:hypothetical protein